MFKKILNFARKFIIYKGEEVKTMGDNKLHNYLETIASESTKKPELKREDLHYTYDHFGYNLTYKGRSIGGAGVKEKGRRIHSNLKFHKSQAEMEIDHLIKGHGDKRFYDAIQKIEDTDKQNEK